MPVYITSLGTFLPGPPVENDSMEEFLECLHATLVQLKRQRQAAGM